MTSNARPTADIEELRVLVAAVLELPVTEVTDQADFADDLNVDSLLELELAARLEKAYGIEIPEVGNASFTSLAHIRDLVERLLDAKSIAAESNTSERTTA
ncbi:acyl carrier protein [Nocardia sp. CA-135398]|uniref:acyl carrier protein n=1 Tax=Nocardia sp. CA-135398 TaxID=3239977 RepID=UPI003D95E8FD